MTNIRHARRKLGVLGGAVGAAVVMLFVVPATAAQSNGGAVHAGTVHANFVSTTGDGNGPGPLALHGAISAFCTDNQGSNVDHVVCPTGTFVLDHSAQGGKQHFNMNPITCIGVFSFSGAPFSVKHGTGAYKGISGNGLAHGTSWVSARSVVKLIKMLRAGGPALAVECAEVTPVSARASKAATTTATPTLERDRYRPGQPRASAGSRRTGNCLIMVSFGSGSSSDSRPLRLSRLTSGPG